MSSVAEKIKQRRIELGLSQRKLADMVGSTQMQIWRYEMDKSDPTAKIVAALAQVLDVSSDWLLSLDERKHAHRTDEEEQELLKLYHSKTPESKKKLLEIAKVV